MIIQNVKKIAFDTSHLGQMAKDHFSSDSKKRERSSEAVATIYASGFVPVISHHHLHELLGIENVEVARQRIDFLGTMDHMGWIKSYDDYQGLGGVVDILSYETKAAFFNPQWDVGMVRDEVAKSIVRFGSGAQAISQYSLTWQSLQPLFWEQAKKSRDIVAVAQSGYLGMGKTKVHDWLKGEMRKPADIAHRMNVMSNMLAQDISETADKRITSPTDVSDQFFQRVNETSINLPAGTANPGELILKQQHIDISEVGSEMTMDDIGKLVIFRAQLKVVNQNLNFNWDQLRTTVSPDRIPSWSINNALNKYRQIIPERKGSDLADGYLASLSAYLDVTCVDKRTKENFNRAERQSSLVKAISGKTYKGSNYSELCRGLAHI